jgi:ribosomal protein S6--L-glutamate ligase
LTVLSEQRIELWVEARNGAPAVNPIMRFLLDELAAAGADVSIRVPEHEIINPEQLLDGRPPDLVLLKSATTLTLSLAVADETHGVKFLNAARETLRVHDKAATVARLAAAGLPVPETCLLDGGAERPQAPAGARGEWVVKPVRGVHGRGVAVHPNLASALTAPAVRCSDGSCVVDDGTRLVQRRIGGGEADVKVYVAGERCFAASKPFSPVSYAADDTEPFDLDHTMAKMVHAVGEALKLRCFGVDVRFVDGRPVIIDANPFPGYRGFPDAVPALRGEIERALKRVDP